MKEDSFTERTNKRYLVWEVCSFQPNYSSGHPQIVQSSCVEKAVDVYIRHYGIRNPDFLNHFFTKTFPFELAQNAGDLVHGDLILKYVTRLLEKDEWVLLYMEFLKSNETKCDLSVWPEEMLVSLYVNHWRYVEVSELTNVEDIGSVMAAEHRASIQALENKKDGV